LKPKIFQYNNLIIETHPEVYEPSEDTFQLLEALKINEGNSVFEIGTGCGIIALFCASIGANVICSDINPYAIETTKKNFQRNKTKIKGSFKVRKGDLFSVVKQNEFFDVIIFNPPYLPTKSNEKIGGSGWFDKSVDGGLDGLKTTNKFLNQIDKFLNKNGRAYFVFSSLSDRKKLEQNIKFNNFTYEVIKSKNYNDETIDIYLIKNSL